MKRKVIITAGAAAILAAAVASCSHHDGAVSVGNAIVRARPLRDLLACVYSSCGFGVGCQIRSCRTNSVINSWWACNCFSRSWCSKSFV